jgi:acetolactate synthase-1/2/3 large subunit
MKMTGAKYMADTIKSIGSSHVFLMETSFWETMYELQLNDVKRIICHTEKSAAYMADGYARLSRRPGFVFCQSVGAANMAAGLQDPFLSNSPVVAITGKKDQIFQHRNSYQELNHHPLFEPVTKYNVSIDTIEQLPLYFKQAVREAVNGNPGPAHLDMINLLGFLDRAEGDFQEDFNENNFRVPAHRIIPEADSIDKVAELLKSAVKPVIIAGGGVNLSDAGEAVTKLAEKLNIPIATSVNGKGSISEDHYLSVGCVGNYCRNTANEIVAKSDLIIYIGSHTNDQVTLNWTIPGKDKDIVQMDIDPLELGRNYLLRAGVLGDARLCADALAASAPASKHSDWLKEIHAIVAKWYKEEEGRANSDDIPIRPERICKELEDVMSDDAVLVSDTGHAAIWTCSRINIKGNQSYLRPGGGSLGWGYPASLGAKCAAGERPVFCFTGDGGLWYHLTAMETQLRYGIKTVTVVNNNYGYGQGSSVRRSLYTDKPFEHENYEFGKNASFADIAKSMGAFAVRVEKPAEIGPALRKAIESDKPALVEIVSDIKIETPAPWAPVI